MTNIAANLQRASGAYPDRVALVFGAEEVTYADVDRASAAMARRLCAWGVRPGDTVGLMMPNVPYFVAAYYGILRVGAVVVPMNPLLKEREITHYLSDSGTRLVLVWDEYEPEASAGAAAADARLVAVRNGDFDDLRRTGRPADPVTERAELDAAVVLYTSGTTGTPKGAELTHRGIGAATRLLSDVYHLTKDDVLLGVLPLFHAFGQVGVLNTAVLVGARVVLMPRFRASDALALIQRYRVSVFQGVPTMYTAMLHADNRGDADTSSLRFCVSGGAPIPVETLLSFQDMYCDTVIEGYGMSETSAVITMGSLDHPRKAGSIGFPLPGLDVRIVDDLGNPVPTGERGELIVRGWNVMRRYLNLPGATAEMVRDGWLYTGDVGFVDEDGYYFLAGRKKELIIRGGYNVYPREIEAVLHQHPAVREAAVVGIPDELLGEEIGAAVSLRPGAEDSDVAAIRQFVKDRVAAYRYPRHIWVMDELPKGPSGKILKREIALPGDLHPETGVRS